jgi:hypothetical protein
MNSCGKPSLDLEEGSLRVAEKLCSENTFDLHLVCSLHSLGQQTAQTLYIFSCKICSAACEQGELEFC